ncbi:MAG TPA: alpha/beta hydrolase [Anaerolineae bacterium]|nr:alpha/beta hydrolase [Anaerolineae bacterium]
MFLVVIGFAYQQMATARDRQAMPMRGELVSVGDYQLHLVCEGAGSPTVLFESGFGSWSVDWLHLQQELAQETRVCSYDRAGLGWSEGAGRVLTVEAMARNLHTLLANGGESGPYVLVGHSLGGILVRAFYGQYGDEVAGMVLVDSAHENQTQRTAEVVGGEGRESDPLQIVLQICRVVGPVGVIRLLGVPDAFFGGLSYSEEQYEEVMGLANQNGYCEAMQYENELVWMFTQEEQALVDLEDVPLLVLSNVMTAEQVLSVSGVAEVTAEEMADLERSLQVANELSQELAALSTAGEWRPITNTTHYIHLDKPEVVLAGIWDVLEEVTE